MDVKILQPVTTYIKTFKTVDEFNLFYNKNKAELDAQTTQMLNKKYFVEGYRLTKIKNELMLRKYDDTMKRYFSRKDEQELHDNLRDEIQSQIDELRTEAETLAASYESLKKEISSIKDSVNKIILYLNPDAEK